MKLKAIIIRAVTVMTMGFIVAPVSAIAASGSYYPPERIHCTVNDHKLSCEGFNRQYLVEDAYTADFHRNKEQVFSFMSGAAYFNSNRSEATVFYTYNNSQHKNVKLRSASTIIRPDFDKGNWVKVQEDLYVCKAGYMQCPIISAPSEHRV